MVLICKYIVLTKMIEQTNKNMLFVDDAVKDDKARYFGKYVCVVYECVSNPCFVNRTILCG